MRRFRSERRISLSDTDASGRLRLDAIARYLQDLATEDWLAAGFDLDEHVWVVRRTRMQVDASFAPEAVVSGETWCNGMSGSAASRRYSLVGAGGGRVEAESIWIHLDHDLHPKRLDARFAEVYGASAEGRRASTHLELAMDIHGQGVGHGYPWSFRSTDVDRLGHVNNAAYWVPLEEAWARRLAGRFEARLEYRQPIDLGEAVRVVADGDLAWLVVADEVRSAARLDPDGAREAEQLA